MKGKEAGIAQKRCSGLIIKAYNTRKKPIMFEEYLNAPGVDDEPEFMPMMSLEEEDEPGKTDAFPSALPVLPLKNTVMFPGVVIPITIGRDKSIKAVHHAYDSHRYIAVFSQKDSSADHIGKDDLYQVGTVARIMRLLNMPDGSTTAILQGRKRIELVEMISETPFMQADVRLIEYEEAKNKMEYDALISTVRDKAKQIVELSPNIPNEATVMLRNISSSAFLLNFIASNMNIKLGVKQAILKMNNLSLKAETILQHMDSELQLLELKSEIESKVRGEMDKQQRDYFLNQQLKTIQEELGGNPQEAEMAILAERAKKKQWPEAVGKHFEKEMNKVRRMNSQVAEYSMSLTYLETLLDLPWNEYTKDNFDLKKVKKILDKDHFGLEDVKTRILEHLAVLKLKGDMKAPIILLVGPPGVGKTSLGKSIARALKRKFIRMSLGGLHDEAEIRGHRKTYIGALPGRIIQSMRKAGSSNPVFILDEIDKVGNSFRGDPSSALLEALDPEQNSAFYDNYLEQEFDLSKVLFIATANSLETIQPALLDRMEVIRLSGYSVEEKVEIAKRHLIPDQLKEHGLKSSDVQIKSDAVSHIIADYTRESGVRSLDRQIAQIMRWVARKKVMAEPYEIKLTTKELKEALGGTKYTTDLYENDATPGVAIGLAWTQVGGDILFIETSLSKGKGGLTLTGNLGAVMKESASTALSFLKSHAEQVGVDERLFDERDVHIHVPEGAIPKDGPSAGVTMMTSLASAFRNKPIKPFLAMTGEITLRGKVLPVGGIKEKILAAKRAGVKEIILCRENRKDVEEVNASYINGLHFQYVDRMQEVLNIALA